MKILILGATGFIGRNMVENFAPTYDVTAVDHVKPRFDYPGVNWICADLRKPFDFTGYDIVIHAAATTSGSRDIVNTPALHVTDNAVMGSYIFRGCAEAGVKHVIFFSCTVMYPDGVCTEETPPAPHPKYFGVAHTKMYLEKMCEFYSKTSDTRFTIIRHSNIYGPHDKFDLERGHVFGATMKKVMDCQNSSDKQESITVWGTGEEKRDLLHVSDLCRFVYLAIERQPIQFALYNCGSGEAVSVNDLAAKIIACGDKDIYIKHDLSAPTIPTSLSLDCSRAREELGWEPRMSLDEGIRKTWEWYKDDLARAIAECRIGPGIGGVS